MKKVNSIYENKNTIINEIDPFVKYLGVLLLGTSSLISPSPILGYILLIFLIFVAYQARFIKEFIIFIFSFGIPILLMLGVIQGIFSSKNHTILFSISHVNFYLEGIIIALKIVGSLLVFIGAFWITSKTTETGRMVASFERVGLKGYAGYLILATLRVIPQMQSRMRVIKNAQNARGLETEGNLLKRIKAFIPLIGPIIMSSLLDVEERGMTLELRGFTIKGIKKTRLIEAIETNRDRKIKRFLWIYFFVSTIISFYLRIMGG